MSLDFYLEEVRATEVYSRNITHNVSQMWRKAGCYDALYMSDGIKASAAVPFLGKAIIEMEDKPSEYKELNPENGWGSFEVALEFLREVRRACESNPGAVIRVSK